MIRTLFENAKNNIDARNSLGRLRQEIKTDDGMDKLFEVVDADMEGMKEFLHNDDPKVRKNAALLMGALDMSDFAEPLFEGYKSEEQLFVRTAYLEALLNYDITPYLDYFKGKIKELSVAEVTEENKKHISEELRALTELIIRAEGIKKHVFNGFHNPMEETYECILLANKNNLDVTRNILADKDVELLKFKGGVRLRTSKLSELRDIRTYSDILFVIPGLESLEFEPENAADAIAGSDIVTLLKSLHRKSDEPFYFRVELKSSLDLEKKSKFAKRFCAQLERATSRKLINTTSDYEVEIRLIENKDGRLNTLIKLYTIKDERFSYLKKHSSVSIRPVNAALCAQLAKEYLTENGNVLDPFCGVGTMLIERQKVVKAGSVYGVDIDAGAIEAARINTNEVEQIVHYINRDFFTFEHDYLFDEIFTDMPFAANEKNLPELEMLYRRFFVKAKKVLKENGTIIMYTRNPGFANKYARANGYNILKGYPIAESTQLMIFR